MLFKEKFINIVRIFSSLFIVICFSSSDDYFDTEDPSVNLHEFIVNSMQV